MPDIIKTTLVETEETTRYKLTRVDLLLALEHLTNRAFEVTTADTARVVITVDLPTGADNGVESFEIGPQGDIATVDISITKKTAVLS